MAEELKMVEPTSVQPVKLDLACGQVAREGFEGVDLYAPTAKHKVDLFKFPYPWADSSVDELHSSHFVEHLPARPVEMSDISATSAYPIDLDERTIRGLPLSDFIGKDFFFAFFDECWRILKPGGTMYVIVPSLRSNRAFQDPTHRRFICQETFLYLAAEWRKLNRLDHYNVKCNFGLNVVHTMPEELGLLHPEAQQRRFNESWNTTIDFHATLIKQPAIL